MSIERLFVRPAQGLIIRDPITLKALDTGGEWKPQSTYWTRRLLCGDCVEGEPPNPKEATVEVSASPVIDEPQQSEAELLTTKRTRKPHHID
jgi:hypothetical protein